MIHVYFDGVDPQLQYEKEIKILQRESDVVHEDEQHLENLIEEAKQNNKEYKNTKKKAKDKDASNLKKQGKADDVANIDFPPAKDGKKGKKKKRSKNKQQSEPKLSEEDEDYKDLAKFLEISVPCCFMCNPLQNNYYIETVLCKKRFDPNETIEVYLNLGPAFRIV